MDQRGVYRVLIATLACLAQLAPALAQAAELHLRYTGDLSSGFDNNVSNSQDDREIRDSAFVSGGAHADYRRELSEYMTIVLRGSLQGEYWARFDGLSNGKATLLSRVLYRADGDFFTPLIAAWVSAADWEFNSAIRDSYEYRGGVSATEQLTTLVSARLALAANRRDSAGRAFDLSGWSALLNLDWIAAPHSTAYTSYQWYQGGVVSTSAPNALRIGRAAEAIEPDDAFGGLAANERAYRLDARSQVVTLGVNQALASGLSLDLQGQYIDTRADFGNAYQRMIAVVSLLARF